MYPLEYFALANVQRIKYPDRTWWSSRQRFATVDPGDPVKQLALEKGGQSTSEYLEIDLGRVREVNYLNFQIMKAPIDIHIEYDPVSSDDGTHQWVRVAATEDMPFDDAIHFDPDARNAWFHAQFYFNDSEGNQVSTRFLRLRFKRRPHAWPTKTSPPFRWPVSIKALRTARLISSLKDTVGTLINTGAGDEEIQLDLNDNGESYEIRQRFQMPDDYLRGDIAPSMMGFSFETTAPNPIALGDINSTTSIVTLDDMEWKWRLMDATDPTSAVQLLTGVTSGGQNGERTWVNVFFDPAEPLQPDPDKVYELRLRSLKADAASTVFAVTYNTTSPMPGGFQTDQIHSDGTTETLSSTCLAMRIWGDVAETGTDVLGNIYRYGTRRDNAHYVYDNTKVGWMCEPQPSPEAVESLYFDVRIPDPTNDARKIPSVIDAFQVVPRTQGVRMHVYYTDHALAHGKPHDRDDWDNLIWTPVNVTYTLRGGNQIIELPQSIRTTYIKLEFSRLQPLPFRLPTNPKLPVKEYHRYPTWVEEQFANTEFKRTINDWFVKNSTPRMRRVLKDLSDPVQEFQYEEREFLASLSTGDLSKQFANSQFVDVKDRALVDPVTGSKLFIDDGRLYTGTLTANVDRDSVLGSLVADRFDPKLANTVIEGTVNRSAPVAPKVSTQNNRVEHSFAFLASTPMWFNRRCRHHYKVERAEFNKQAYFVGVNSVQFFRKDYTTRRDDSLIMDNLHDDHNLAENTFQFDSASAIWRALPPYQTQNQEGLTLYVSYSINPTYTDEPVTFYAPASGDPTDTPAITLSGAGGAAYNVTVTSQPGGEGVIYQPGIDYDISYGTDPNTGDTTNIISVSTLSSRAVATTFERQVDAEQVVGRAVIFADETYFPSTADNYEASIVPGIAVPTSLNTLDAVDAAMVIGVADVRQSGYADSALVTGSMDQPSVANSFEQYIAVGGINHTDSFTVTGVAVVTTADGYGKVDAATVTGVFDLTSAAAANNDTDYIDPYFIGPSSSAGAGVAIRQGGVGSNLVDTQTLYGTVPDANVLSVWIPWKNLQPTGPNDLSGWTTVTSGGHTLDDSFDHAAAHGYKIIFRVSCGADAPSWLYNTGVVGSPAVTELKTIANDGGGPISIPLFWDSKLLTNYQTLLDKLAAKFDPTNPSGVTAGGTRRSDYTLFMAVAMPTEQGTEMTIGYGSAPTYTGAATLFSQGSSSVAGSITAADTSIKLQGTVTGYVAPMLLKIDSELMYCSAFNAGTKVATVVRGFSGSTAAGHNTGAAATYLDQTAGGAWPTVQNTTGVYNSVTGIYENQTLNKSVWEASGRTLATNQSNTKTAWLNAIDAHTSHFTSITNIPSCVAVGSIFVDGYANAQAIATARASKTIWFMTTNLQPGKIANSTQIAAEVAAGNSGAALNDPTKYDKSGTLQATYYEAWSTAPAATIRAAIAAGGIIGFQTAGQSVFNTFNTPYAGDGKAFRVALEDGLSAYDPVFIEINTTLATSNNPAAGGTDTTYHYLFGV
jgi:hypothetical protein